MNAPCIPETHELKAFPSKYGPRWWLSSEVILIKFLFRETTCYSLLRTPLKTTIIRSTRVKTIHKLFTGWLLWGMKILICPDELWLVTTLFMQAECLLRISRRIYKKPAKLKHPSKIGFYPISENTILCLGNKQCFYRVTLSRFIYVWKLNGWLKCSF